MTTKELKQILNENRKVVVKLDGVWELVQAKDSMHKDNLVIQNYWTYDREILPFSEGVKYFMQRYNYINRKYKRHNGKGLPSFQLEIEVG